MPNIGGSFKLGVTTWLGLDDTPNSYAGQAGKLSRVNAGENGLELATVIGIPYDDFFAFLIPESLDGYNQSKSANGSINISGDGLYLSTGGTAGHWAEIEKTLSWFASFTTFDKKREANYFVRFVCPTNQIGTFYIGPSDFNKSNSMYFYVKDGVLYGCTRDSAGTNQVTLETLGTTNFDARKRLKIKWIPGEKCEFYVDGVLAGTSTDNLPSGQGWSHYILTARVQNDTKDADNKLYILGWSIYIPAQG